MLVSKRLTDLMIGYARILDAQEQLEKKWRQRLLMAYARRREGFSAALSRYRQRVSTLNAWLPWAFAGTALLCLMGYGLTSITDTGGRLIVALGLFGAFILGTAWLWVIVVSKPKPPPHPLREPLRRKLFQPLLPRWRRHLAGKLPRNMPDYGARGEVQFVRQLQRVLEDDFFIIHRLQQQYGDDVDVTLVGPKGIWVFEVKYWSGRITWRHGRWAREQSHHESGGVLVTEHPQVRQPPERQWQRMAQEVAKTLRYRRELLVDRLSALTQIRGGVVFTGPNARYDIAEDAPFDWGGISWWTRNIAQVPPVAGIDESVNLQVLEALLSRHQQITGERDTRSMDDYAQELIRQTEARLKAWISQGA